jgi:hypothetical protein
MASLREMVHGLQVDEGDDQCKKNRQLAHLVWILMLDEQHDHLGC